jgi:hypothetical protein
MAEPALLPAPYESPWRALLRALQAVVADLRLQLRRLWRLRPGLVIGLALVPVLVVVAGLGLQRLRPPAVPEPLAAPAAPASAPPATAAAAPAAPADPSEARPSPPPAQEPIAERIPERIPESIPEPAPAAPEPEPDPLLAAFAAADPAGWIASAQPRPERDLLTLTLAASTPSGDPRLRRRLERWQELALGLGYGNLEVCTSEGRLLARNALVGSGMILPAFASPS